MSLWFDYQKQRIEAVTNVAKQKLKISSSNVVPAENRMSSEARAAANQLERARTNSAFYCGDFSGAVSARMKRLEALFETYDQMMESMKRSTAAPHFLGLALTESKLLAVRGYIVSVIALFIGSLFKDYVALMQNE